MGKRGAAAQPGARPLGASARVRRAGRAGGAGETHRAAGACPTHASPHSSSSSSSPWEQHSAGQGRGRQRAPHCDDRTPPPPRFYGSPGLIAGAGCAGSAPATPQPHPLAPSLLRGAAFPWSGPVPWRTSGSYPYPGGLLGVFSARAS